MKPFPKLPNPSPDFAGRNFVERASKEAFARIAKLWQPSGEENEPTHCTVSRHSAGLIDKTTGKSYSTDELMSPDLIVPAIQGFAANPERIGSEFMPEELQIFKITLRDASALTLDSGELSGDSEGNAVIGDGETLGGVRLMKDLPIPSQHGIAVVNEFPALTPVYFLKLGEIHVKAIDVQENTRVILDFNVMACPKAFSNLTDLSFCIRAPGQTFPKELTFPAVDTPGSANKIHCYEGVVEVIFSALVDTELLNLNGSSQFLSSSYPNTPGSPTCAASSIIIDALVSSDNGPYTPGIAAILELGVWIKTSDATLSGELAIKGKWTYQIL